MKKSLKDTYDRAMVQNDQYILAILCLQLNIKFCQKDCFCVVKIVFSNWLEPDPNKN